MTAPHETHVCRDCGAAITLPFAVDGNLEGYWERAYDRLVPRLLAALVNGPHVPTPDELDTLLSDISACGYASEAREIVENWTRKWWGVESAFTTKWDRS